MIQRTKPVVFQANKRDLPHLRSTELLGSKVTAKRCAYVESVATKRIGTEAGTFGRPYASAGLCGAVAF